MTKTAAFYCEYNWMLLEETPFFFHPKLEIPFCNACLAESNIRDQTQLSYHLTLEGGGDLKKHISCRLISRGKNDLQGNTLGKNFLYWKKKTLNIMLVVNNTLACGFYFHTSSWWSLRENRGSVNMLHTGCQFEMFFLVCISFSTHQLAKRL